MLINLTERDACLSVHLEECLATNGVSVRKIAGEKKNQKIPSSFVRRGTTGR